MAFSDAAKKLMLDGLSPGTIYVSLHTADPGTTGASELSGGSPAYARKSITWNAVTAGNLDSSNVPVFDVPASTVTHLGYWSASSAGTYYCSAVLSASETFAAQGTYTLNDADISL